MWCLGDSLGQSFSSPEQCLGVEVLLVRRCILGNRRRSDFSEHQGDSEFVLSLFFSVILVTDLTVPVTKIL